MRIAVVTPYFKESISTLRRCHESVLTQGSNITHIMVADGYPIDELDSWNIHHIKLPIAHSDNGNTPRGIGSIFARNNSYDFISYLDADNWFHTNHICSLISLYKQEKSPIVSSLRTFHTLDGIDMKISEPYEDSLAHVDTSCLLLHKSVFDLTFAWITMNKVLSPICDRVFIALIRHHKYEIISSKLRTVAFTSQYAYHYKKANIEIPKNSKTNSEFKNALNYLQSVEGIEDCLNTIKFWPLPYFKRKR
jgi:glycosyltransferase involved in cell wall biosynthesis